MILLEGSKGQELILWLIYDFCGLFFLHCSDNSSEDILPQFSSQTSSSLWIMKQLTLWSSEISLFCDFFMEKNHFGWTGLKTYWKGFFTKEFNKKLINRQNMNEEGKQIFTEGFEKRNTEEQIIRSAYD